MVSTWAGACAALMLVGPFAPGTAAQQPSMAAVEQELSGHAPRPRSSASELDRALAARQYDRAARLLADAIARHPTSRDLLTQIANVFMLDGKPLNAAIALKKAEALAPLENHLRLQLALAYVAMGRHDWARPELERLAESEPANVIYPYWLARLDYDAGQYAAAIRGLQRVVAQDPAFMRAHDNLGLCYEALNQPDEAIAHYREAIRLNRLERKRSPWPALNLGILLRNRGELDEAEQLFREALTHDPVFAPASYQLGVVLEGRGRVHEAVRALRRAATLDAGYAEPLYALSRIYRRQGDTRKADAALATFQRLHDAQRAQRAAGRATPQ